MESLLVMIQHNGKWIEANKYEDFEVIGIMIPQDTSYLNLLEIISKELKLNLQEQRIQIKYQVKIQYPPLKITDDSSFKFYMEIKKMQTDFTMYPLCVDISSDTLLIQANQQSSRSISTGISCSDYSKKNQATEMEVDTSMIHLPYSGDTFSEIRKYATLLAKDCAETSSVNDKEMLIEETSAQAVAEPVKEIELKADQSFKNKAVLQTCMRFHAISHHYQYKTVKSCQKQLLLKCINDTCNWYLKSSSSGNSKLFIIRNLNMKHICPVDARFNCQRQASSSHIADSIKQKFLNVKSTYTPTDIKNDLEMINGVNISYMMAYRSREKAFEMIRGNPAESYKFLPTFLQMLGTTNPGSAIDIQVREDHSFLYVFTALNASIKGWQHCSPVMIVDGTFLKAAYGGTLLVATAQDAAGKLFPLAFCIVDSENDKSWEYFFSQIRNAFGTRQGMCIVSDRHLSIDNAAKTIFPEVDHCLCIFHLLNNIKTNFKRSAKKVKEPFIAAAKAYTKQDFDYHMNELDNIDARIKPYLDDIGYKRWSRYHSECNRYKTMTSNPAESLNATLKQARELPVATLLMYLHDLQQEYSYKHRNIAMYTITKMAKKHEDVLAQNYVNSLKLQVKPSTNEVITVLNGGIKYTVNMKDRTCTCKRFEIDEIPCQHAVAIINEMNRDPYQYCSIYYMKETMLATYSETVFPMAKEDEWDIPQQVKEFLVLPPQHKTKSGRPKKQRYKSSSEKTANATCTRCGKCGHNRKTCRNVPKKTSK
ncbi:uncharacterized protein LOC130015425 [Mercurialis annua]|uniref:uncharacterized protein LOC130015425 n=1 Tax=Mercurialis annua TaxID=3986 RepID=UPI0024AF9F58|nr:uncharacterized protein LOC130015425 [Mercurialis annua]